MPNDSSPSSDLATRTVWVFRIQINALTVSVTNLVRVPVGSTLLHCALQRGDVALWFEVDPTADKEALSFQLIGTGQPIRPGLTHIQTVIVGEQQDLVLHVYEVES